MKRLPARLTPHTVSVRAHLGDGPEGPIFGDAATVAAQVLAKQKRVSGQDGLEIVSSTQVFVNADVMAPIGSKITVWAGKPFERTSRVIAADYYSDTSLPAYQALYLE